MTPDLRQQLNDRIQNSGFSLRKIAAIADVNAGQLSRALRSEERSLISVDTLERLAQAMGARLILMDQNPATELLLLLADNAEQAKRLLPIVRKLLTLNHSDIEIVHSVAERLSEKK